MLKISDSMGDELIIDELNARNKADVLREFSDLLAANGAVGDKDELVRILSAREALGSTGIGEGVAIPHGKIKGMKGLVLAFGRSTKGVEFDSLDGQPAHLFFLLLAPEDAPGEHLKALARISRLMKNGGFREALMRASDKKEIKRIIAQEEDARPG